MHKLVSDYMNNKVYVLLFLFDSFTETLIFEVNDV